MKKNFKVFKKNTLINLKNKINSVEFLKKNFKDFLKILPNDKLKKKLFSFYLIVINCALFINVV